MKLLLYGYLEHGGKSVYDRRSLRLTDMLVANAISLSQEIPVGTMLEWLDERTVGLTLRITPGNAVWYVRRRETTLRLGYASDIALEEARYIAEQIRLGARRKRNLRTLLSVLLGLGPPPRDIIDPKHDERDAKILYAMGQWENAKKPPRGMIPPFWTWKTLTEHFLAYQKPKRKLSIGSSTNTI